MAVEVKTVGSWVSRRYQGAFNVEANAFLKRRVVQARDACEGCWLRVATELVEGAEERGRRGQTRVRGCYAQ